MRALQNAVLRNARVFNNAQPRSMAERAKGKATEDTLSRVERMNGTHSVRSERAVQRHVAHDVSFRHRTARRHFHCGSPQSYVVLDSVVLALLIGGA